MVLYFEPIFALKRCVNLNSFKKYKLALFIFKSLIPDKLSIDNFEIDESSCSLSLEYINIFGFVKFKKSNDIIPKHNPMAIAG